MIITKYAIIDTPLNNDTLNEALNEITLSYIFDTKEDAMNAIMENGFQSHTYLVPLDIEVSNIRQVKLSFEPAFE